MDLSQLSTDDLKALQGGDLSKVSTGGLTALHSGYLADQTAALSGPTTAAGNPTNGMSALDRGLAAMGSGTASVLRAVGGGSLAAKLDLPATKEEADALDAPLMATTAGKVGRVIGQAATLAPAMLIPGVNTYAGATALGAGLGAATTEGDLADRAKGAAFGAAGGAAGQGLGQLVGAGVNRLFQGSAAAGAARGVARAGKDAAADNAQAAGYVLPPTEVNPSVMNSLLEGLSGKIKTSQAASQTNQSTTNALAADALGLPRNVPITPQALQGVRAQAGQAYDAVANSGVITPTPAYGQALDQITAPYIRAAQGFPNAAPHPVIAAIDGIRSPQFDASAALAQIRNLRDAADSAFTSGDRGMGRSLRQGADALEDAIDTHLQGAGAPDLLQGFRDARRQIAQTYTVEKGLNATTGDVSAKALGAQLAKGKPLTGDLRTIAEANQAFPKATQSLPQDYNAVSPLDYLAGTAASAAGHPLAALTTFGRPAVRTAILSPAYQRFAAGGRNYDANPLAQLLDAVSPSAQRALPATGIAAGTLPATYEAYLRAYDAAPDAATRRRLGQQYQDSLAPAGQ